MTDFKIKNEDLLGKKISNIEKEWDIYWEKSPSKKLVRKLYDTIASFYRKYLIGPTFKEHIKKNLLNNCELLHAGCGGGEVDSFIIDDYNITAVDISSNALELYKKINKDKAIMIKSNIFNMDFNGKKFDGIYNLGVVEHFVEKEFIAFLEHIKMHLSSDGKIILFWPPSYGLSVIALHLIHFFINIFLKRKIKLHSDEPFKFTSLKKVKKTIKPIGLEIVDKSFSYKDAFTYVVLVLKRI